MLATSRFKDFLPKWVANRYRRRISKALALQKRGEVRADGLEVIRSTTKLYVTWSARDIHPWDRTDLPEIKAAKYIDQTLHDTEAAIRRLFKTLPELDIISATVLDHRSEKIIMIGTVHRSAIDENAISINMRLMNWGMKFFLEDSRFKTLSLTNA